MKKIFFILILISVVLISGCNEEKQIINNLNFSNEYSSSIAGGWARFASTLTNADAGRYNWTNTPSEFSTTVYVIENIITDSCPNNPNLSYVLFSQQGKENNEEISKQIFKDIQDNQKDINKDGEINQEDLAIIIQTGEQPKGDIQPAPEWIAMAKQLPRKNLAVHPKNKVATTWASLKKEK